MPTDPNLLHSVFPGIYPDPQESTMDTCLDHINTARRHLADINDHANQHLVAQIAQAHALVAIAMLLEESIDTPSADTTVQTVRIVGGWPNHTAH